MVTPVDPKYLAADVQDARDRPDDFTRRVGTTLAFLEFVRECEDQFRDPKLVANTAVGASSSARDAEARLPLEAHGAVATRIAWWACRESGYLRTIDPAWWDSTIGSPFFVQAREARSFSAGHGV